MDPLFLIPIFVFCAFSEREKMLPVIGITCDMKKETREKTFFFLKKNYMEAVALAGGLPLLLPPFPDLKTSQMLKQCIDGLLLSGGDFDVPPEQYGEARKKGLGNLLPERTNFETDFLAYAIKRTLPTLGICGGHQLINTHLGGNLYQDLPAEHPTSIDHSPGEPAFRHSVTLEKNSELFRILGEEKMKVNSTHHQAIKQVGNGLRVSARSDDGIVEALESKKKGFLIGVQWHPESLTVETPAFKELFQRFVSEAEKFSFFPKKG